MPYPVGPCNTLALEHPDHLLIAVVRLFVCSRMKHPWATVWVPIEKLAALPVGSCPNLPDKAVGGHRLPVPLGIVVVDDKRITSTIGKPRTMQAFLPM